MSASVITNPYYAGTYVAQYWLGPLRGSHPGFIRRPDPKLGMYRKDTYAFGSAQNNSYQAIRTPLRHRLRGRSLMVNTPPPSPP